MTESILILQPKERARGVQLYVGEEVVLKNTAGGEGSGGASVDRSTNSYDNHIMYLIHIILILFFSKTFTFSVM